MDLQPADAEVFDHDMGIDRRPYDNGFIGHLHKTMVRRCTELGGLYVYIVEMPLVERHRWGLVYRSIELITGQDGAITIPNCGPRGGGQEQQTTRNLIPLYRVQSSKITVLVELGIIRVELILDRMVRGREIYLHSDILIPGRFARVITFPVAPKEKVG